MLLLLAAGAQYNFVSMSVAFHVFPSYALIVVLKNSILCFIERRNRNTVSMRYCEEEEVEAKTMLAHASLKTEAPKIGKGKKFDNDFFFFAITKEVNDVRARKERDTHVERSARINKIDIVKMKMKNRISIRDDVKYCKGSALCVRTYMFPIPVARRYGACGVCISTKMIN